MHTANQREDHITAYDFDDADHHESFWLGYVRENPAQTALTGVVAATFFAFCVNALFLQTHNHPSSWFETRATSENGSLRADERTTPPAGPAGRPEAVTQILIDPQTTALIPPPAERPVRPAEQYVQLPDAPATPEPTTIVRPAPEAVVAPVMEIQTRLQALGFYAGDLDGISGPQTTGAINAYMKSAGLEGVTMSSEQLLNHLRRSNAVASALPTEPTPVIGSEAVAALDERQTAPEAISQRLGPSAVDPNVLRVQAGLKAFGNSAISVDGVFGSQTRASIREFQALFELPVTGEIDQALIDKMVTVGLID